MAKAPAAIEFASIVSRKTVRISLILLPSTILRLIRYSQAFVTENVWTTLDPEFDEDARKTSVISRALYSLKSAEAAFRSHLALCQYQGTFAFRLIRDHIFSLLKLSSIDLTSRFQAMYEMS